MPVTEAEINELLERLEALLKQIEPLRTRLDTLEKELVQAQREYDEKLGEANAEADRLEAMRISLDARLNRKPLPPPSAPPPGAEPTPPPSTIPIDSDGEILPLPPPPRESLRGKRKRALLDFIFTFTDSGPVIEKINAIVDDERRELGDMLELLTWGEIWKARTEWETLEAQWQRLDEWRVALEQRLSYWKDEYKRLQDNPVWEQRSELSEQAWQALLDDLLRTQEDENQRVANEVAEMEKEWQAQQIKSNEVNRG
jgi:predicted  nucleic acid-binding Zn-ribbon protein